MDLPHDQNSDQKMTNPSCSNRAPGVNRSLTVPRSGKATSQAGNKPVTGTVPQPSCLPCQVGSVHEVWGRMKSEGYFIPEEVLENLVKKKVVPYIKDGKQGYLLHYDSTCKAIVRAINKED